MLIEEDGWEGTVVAKNRVRMCVWVIEMEERRDSGRIAWGRRKEVTHPTFGLEWPHPKQQNCFPSSPLRTENTFLFYSSRVKNHTMNRLQLIR